MKSLFSVKKPLLLSEVAHLCVSWPIYVRFDFSSSRRSLMKLTMHSVLLSFVQLFVGCTARST